MAINLTIWNEFVHEQNPKNKASEIYPEGMHKAIGAGLSGDSEINIRYATLDMPEHGLTEEVLQNTDVLTWWGHTAHNRVSDEVVERVYQHVQMGMGLIVLHSGHHSKIFRKLMGTTGNLKWREKAEHCRIWTLAPTHPITAGLDESFVLDEEETYTEYFDIPKPDDLIFVSWWKGGEIFRSGCTFTRGYGKIFYFQPGHETFPTYYDKNVLKVIDNAVHWAAPVHRRTELSCPYAKPLEPDIYKALYPEDFGGEKQDFDKPHKWTATREDR